MNSEKRKRKREKWVRTKIRLQERGEGIKAARRMKPHEDRVIMLETRHEAGNKEINLEEENKSSTQYDPYI